MEAGNAYLSDAVIDDVFVDLIGNDVRVRLEQHSGRIFELLQACTLPR